MAPLVSLKVSFSCLRLDYTHIQKHLRRITKKKNKNHQRYKWAQSSTSIPPIDFSFCSCLEKNEQFLYNKLCSSVFFAPLPSYLSPFSLLGFYCFAENNDITVMAAVFFVGLVVLSISLLASRSKEAQKAEKKEKKKPKTEQVRSYLRGLRFFVVWA